MIKTEAINILDLPLSENDANAKTIRAYLKALLLELWEKEEGFSGKRPFGNSGWKQPVEVALIRAGLVGGKLDLDGYVEDIDYEISEELITEAINAL